MDRGDRVGRASLEVAIGFAMMAIGAVFTWLVDAEAVPRPLYNFMAYGLFLPAVVLVVYGLAGLTGYQSFVAWRYLLVAQPKVTHTTKLLVSLAVCLRLALWIAGVGFDPKLDWGDPLDLGAAATDLFLVVVVFWGVLRHSKPAMVIFLIGIAILVGAVTVEKLAAIDAIPYLRITSDQTRQLLQLAGGAVIAGWAIAGLATFFGSLRAFFTFFTTVPIGGVWVGSAALVCVLSVMSGFETDLRDKILGSNAHIQITRDDGEFVDWREVKTRIDKIPGVLASTPYAISEVVIAANNNGMNVIIKGIDPETVGNVTDLVSDLEDKDAIHRLQPLVDDGYDRTVPQKPPGDKRVLDPPPDDMPSGGDPIDFSPKAPDTSGKRPRPRAVDLDEPPAVVDPPPSDLVTTDDPPVDYSEPGVPHDSAVHVIDIPLEPTLQTRRTQALPGVLVGRELVKQTHLYTGEEVRIVSPLSDPANPDATGTPIPFNRDYRVAGTFYTGMYEYDLKYVYVTLESLQDFLDRGDAVDGIEVRILDADDTGRFVPTDAGPGLIREALGPGYRIVDWRELNRSLFSALKLEKIAMFLVLGIVILVASFSIVGNLIMVVIEKAREIALLKTLGASDFGVMQLFAVQGLLIGLIGTALGIATGLGLCWGAKRFGLPLNPDVYYIDRLPIHVDPQSVVTAGFFDVLISILATLYPALLAARVRPAAGMRH